MKYRNLAIAAAALMLPFAAVACSDDSTGDLDKGDLSEELQKGDTGLPKEQADCVAEALIDADFSKEDVEAGNLNDLDKDKLDSYMAAVGECVGTEVPAP